MKCKPYSEITVEIRTQLKTVKITSNIFAVQLTLFQPGGKDYAHLITTGTPRFSDLPTALQFNQNTILSTYPFMIDG